MQKLRLLLTVALMVAVSSAFGQKEKAVSLIKEGSKLTDADIGFLSMVANVPIEPGKKTGTVTIKNVTYKAGYKLSKDDAKSLNESISAFQKTYKAPAASRGQAGLCYYWYYYCDYYGYCYWYKYWYYC